MKNIYIVLAGMAALMSASCVFDNAGKTDGMPNSCELTFSFDVESPVRNLTRSGIEAEADEKVVQSLVFLFFDNTADGSGVLRGTVVKEGQTYDIGDTYTLTIPDGIDMAGEYKVLVVANLDKGNYIAESTDQLSGTLEVWANSLAGMTEKEIRRNETIKIEGSDSADTDDGVRIPMNGLAMSAICVKKAGQPQLIFKLVRAVSRFDVYTHGDVSDYKLVSASIWNVFPELSIWDVQDVDFMQACIPRYYGLTHSVADEGKDIVGGLYALENFVFMPKKNDAVSTCLILGYRGPDGEVTYYRVNILPDGEDNQDLVRNNVYKIYVSAVLGPGKNTELDAYTENDTGLIYGLYEWNVDTNDLMQAKDGNILGIPAKKVRLSPDGETKTLSIFTMGSGTLSISHFEGDPAITASLNGNSLKISAPAFTQQNEPDKEAVVEVSFAGMKAIVSVVQSASGGVFLDLSNYTLPPFASTAGAALAGGIQVSASGPWRARLAANVSGSKDVFTFHAGTDKNTLHSSEAAGSMINIATRSSNIGNAVREAVLIVTLDDDPSNMRTVVLTQSGVSEITVLPLLASVTFDAEGSPMGINSFVVAPGSWDDNGTRKYNQWAVADVSGTNFTAAAVWNETDVAGNTLKIESKGPNLTGNTITQKLRVYVVGMEDNTYYDIQIRQLPYAFTFTPASVPDVPKTGGNSQEAKISGADSDRTWTATVTTRTTSGVSLRAGHQAKLVTPGTGVLTDRLENISVDHGIVVNFPKILTPDINVMPEAVVTVTLNGTGLTQTYTVRQEMLIPRPVVIQSYNSGYFSFGANNGRGGSFGGAEVASFLRNTGNFGPSGKVRTSTGITTLSYFDDGVVSPRTTILHANRAADVSQAHWNIIRNWWQVDWNAAESTAKYRNDGNTLLITSDNPDADQFTRFLNGQGYTQGSESGASKSSLNIASSTKMNNGRLRDYLLVSGPFGAVNTSNISSFYMDNVHTKLAGWPSTATPVIVYDGGQALMTIDIKNQLFYIGECQMFDRDSPGISSGGPTNDKGRFFCNVMAVWVNLSQYGSHWGDNFTN